MKNNLKTISIAGGLFLSMILMFLLVNRLWDKQDLETSIYKQAGLPEEEWLRELQSTVTDDGKMIKNAYDSYVLKIPENWLIPKQTSYMLDIHSKEQLQNRIAETELEDIITWPPMEHSTPVLRIYTLQNKKGLEVQEFIDSFQQNISNVFPQKVSFKESNLNDVVTHIGFQEIQSEEDDGKAEGVLYTYIGSGNNKIYIINCHTTLQQCESVIKTFEITE